MQDGFLIHGTGITENRDSGYGVILAMAMVGIVWITGTAFMDSPAWLAMLAAAAAAAGLSFLKNGRAQRAVMLAAALILIVSLIAAKNFVNGGFLQMVNHCIHSYNLTRGTDVYYYTVPSEGSGRMAAGAAAAGVVFIMGCFLGAVLSGKHTGLFGAANLALVLAVLFLKAEPAYAACCFPVMAAAGAAAWSGAGRHAGRQLAMCLAVIMAIGIGAGLAYMRWGNYTESSAVSGIRESVMGRLDEGRYGKEDSYAGSLDKASAYEAGKEVRLRVTASEPGTYYLKGFVGGTYAGGEWTEIDKTSYNRYHEGLFEWLKAQSFSPFSQNSDYLRLLAEKNGTESDSPERTLDIANVHANRRFAYIPYGMTHDTAAVLENANHDMNAGNGSSAEAEYAVDYYDLSTALTSANPKWMDGAGDDVKTYKEAQEEYRDFVYTYYLDTDPAVEKLLDGSLPDVEKENYVNQTIEIRNWLADESTADAAGSGSDAAAGNDLLYNFMGADRRGNSAYYASAAVMMFRHYGVPARYTEGYYVVTGKAGEETDVTGEAIHAWPEIYKDGIGWVPVEVTPGYYDEIKIPQLSDNTENADELPPQADPPKQDPPPQSGESKRQFSVIGILAALAILACIAAATIVIRRYIILIKRRRALFGDDPQAAMPVLLGYTRKLHESGGLDEEAIPEEETDILMHYRFRDGIIAEDSYEKLRDYAYGLSQKLWEGENFGGRLRMRYISVLR